ncbi:extracellular solute-binding protein [Candidatus Nomurabacteria bacterium]|nr:MAG: extracellular solute-binding protein [Candidatus Nomurabacteria bacterium]
MSNFQIALSVIFGFAFLLAVAIFSGFIKIPDRNAGGIEGATGQVVMWGTIDDGAFRDTIEDFNRNKDYSLRYIEKKSSTFDAELIEALASGKGPDLVLVSQDMLWKYKNKAYVIPYEGYSERVFLDTFIPESEIYLVKEGILALPFTVDPLVLYYNKNTFTSTGIVSYPKTWTELVNIVPLLVEKDASGNIIRGAIGMGSFTNVTHAKEILATLFLQSGVDITSYDRTTGELDAAIKSTSNNSSVAEQVTEFFTNFTDPVLSTYTWNTALPESRDAFIAGDLAMYIGYASEVESIRAKNPNLDFDVAPIPQLDNTKTKVTFGDMKGIMIMNASKNRNTAYVVSALLSGNEFLSSFTPNLNLPPVRRDLLASRPTDPILSIFYTEALISRGWIDPSSIKTTDILSRLTSGIYEPYQAVSLANEELSLFINSGI